MGCLLLHPDHIITPIISFTLFLKLNLNRRSPFVMFTIPVSTVLHRCLSWFWYKTIKERTRADLCAVNYLVQIALNVYHISNMGIMSMVTGKHSRGSTYNLKFRSLKQAHTVTTIVLVSTFYTNREIGSELVTVQHSSKGGTFTP